MDYGSFRNEADITNPTFIFDATGTDIISQNKNTYNTPVKIDIATAKADFETEVFECNLGIGTKFSNVVTDNTFCFIIF